MRVGLIALTATALAAAGLCACGPTPEGSAGAKQLVAKAMLAEAQAGRFQPPPSGHHYQGPVDCRVDTPNGFHGNAIYLCKIGISGTQRGHLYEWGAWAGGRLHTHATDPKLIPTVTGPFDPPF
jgi:hypothetical protein